MKKQCPLQWWERHPPSRNDILDALIRTLDVLAEALPLALQHVGEHDQDTQEDFWVALCRLDREEEFLSLASSRRRKDGTDKNAVIKDILCEWLESANSRKLYQKGELPGSGDYEIPPSSSLGGAH